MTSRLSTIATQIETSLADISPIKRNAVAFSIAYYAVESNSAIDAQMNNSAIFNDAAFAQHISNNFDERYFACKDKDSVEALKLFSCARAASSMAFALLNKPMDAIYEAIIATDDMPSIQMMVEKLAK